MRTLTLIALITILSGCTTDKGIRSGENGHAPFANIPAMGDKEMAAMLAEICARNIIPAMAAAVVTGRGTQRVAAVGVRKWGTDVPVTLADQWHLGSDTKIMTSVLAASLVESGKLRWTSTVSEVFPELASSFHPDFRNVSLLQLLSHRSGLPANLDYGALDKLGSVREQRLGAARKGLSKKPANSPGSKFLYSNLGYIVAGAMIERVNGTDWETALRERVFSPLGMESAGFGGLGTRGLIDQPWGHPKRGRPATNNGPEADNPPVLGPAGTVHCSINDWAAFIADQLRGARREAALLRPEYYRELQTSHFGDDYSLGWVVVEREWAGGKALTHTGSNTMYLAVAWLVPEHDFAVLVCTNEGEDSAKAADEAAGRIIASWDR